jgi:preflagellin peptidase FlaK
LGPPLWLPWALTAAVAIYPAVLDAQYRSVPEHLWYLGAKVVAVISFIAYLGLYPLRLLAAFYLESLVAPAAVALAAALGFMGAGDVWASLAIALMIPAPPPGSIMPPSLLIVLLASLLEVTARPIVAYIKARQLGGRWEGLKVILSCGNAHRTRWWFPVGSSAVSESPSEAIARACSNDSEVVLEPGMPFVTFILIALPLALLLELTLFRVP